MFFGKLCFFKLCFYKYNTVFWNNKNFSLNISFSSQSERLIFLTLTEGFPCFFLNCKANARVKLAKTGHGPHSSTLVVICVVRLLFVLFYVLFVCKCVLYYCQWVSTQLQSTNISYHIFRTLPCKPSAFKKRVRRVINVVN
jgi:magnesium-transporting ATPase (P-type)